MEIGGRKPRSEEKTQASPHPGAPPGCPLKLGLQLSCHSPLSPASGRGGSEPWTLCQPKLLARGPSHEALAGGTQAGSPLPGPAAFPGSATAGSGEAGLTPCHGTAPQEPRLGVEPATKSAPTFWWGITGRGDWIGGAAVEMGMGRFDLEKPEMRPREDSHVWARSSAESHGGRAESPRPTAHRAGGWLQEIARLTRVEKHGLGHWAATGLCWGLGGLPGGKKAGEAWLPGLTAQAWQHQTHPPSLVCLVKHRHGGA